MWACGFFHQTYKKKNKKNNNKNKTLSGLGLFMIAAPCWNLSPLISTSPEIARHRIRVKQYREPFLADFNKWGDGNRWGVVWGAWHVDAAVES